MNFNKCNRCGNFYMSQGDVCPKCQAQDNLEYNNFKSYISLNGADNLEHVSQNTNISFQHMNRFMDYYNKDNLVISTSQNLKNKTGGNYEQSF